MSRLSFAHGDGGDAIGEVPAGRVLAVGSVSDSVSSSEDGGISRDGNADRRDSPPMRLCVLFRFGSREGTPSSSLPDDSSSSLSDDSGASRGAETPRFGPPSVSHLFCVSMTSAPVSHAT